MDITFDNNTSETTSIQQQRRKQNRVSQRNYSELNTKGANRTG